MKSDNLFKERTIKKIYRITRSFIIDPTKAIENATRQQRLIVGKAKWRNNADSPVCLTIDDFANAWFDENRNGVLKIGEDWGGMLDRPGSAFDFLQKNLLNLFPEIHITFFTVMGPLSSFVASSPFTYAKPINATNESIRFFKKIHYNRQSEIAYHGYDHGTPGNDNQTFLQEWENITSIEQSLDKIKKGAKIYTDVFGEKPRGGKTGAYFMNRHIEKSIDIYDFFWWCRHWTNKSPHKKSNQLLFEPIFFGNNQVIDIPSTIQGRVWYKRQINNLLLDRQIITIQEHISPFGAGTRYIKPNIIDDMPELQRLYAYLKKKNVWHATVSEIADYIDTYTFTHIFDATKNSFKLSYTGKLKNPILTLMIDPYCLKFNNPKGHLKIKLPDGSTLAGQQYRYDKRLDLFLVDTPVQNGVYYVDWRGNPVPKLMAEAEKDGKITYNQENLTGLIEIAISPNHTSFFNYINNGLQIAAQYSNDNTVSAFCINSNLNDRLIKSN